MESCTCFFVLFASFPVLYGFLLFLFAPTREMNVQHPLQLAYSRGLVCPLVYILVPEKPRITATVPLLYCRVRVYVWCLTILTHNETARIPRAVCQPAPPSTSHSPVLHYLSLPAFFALSGDGMDCMRRGELISKLFHTSSPSAFIRFHH